MGNVFKFITSSIIVTAGIATGVCTGMLVMDLTKKSIEDAELAEEGSLVYEVGSFGLGAVTAYLVGNATGEIVSLILM